MMIAIWSITKATLSPSTAHGSNSQSAQEPCVRSCRSAHQRRAIENGRSTAQRRIRTIIPTIIPAPIGPRPVLRANCGARREKAQSATIVASVERTMSILMKRS